MPEPEFLRFDPGARRWWQWGTILSLDAPIVATLWQWLLARAAHASFAWYHAVILGVSVWLGYAADRWIEGWRLKPTQIRTQRHLFYQRHRWTVAAVWVVALAADVAIAATRLDAREFGAGSLLLIPVFAYLLSHQLIHRDRRWRAPKEICVAGLLATGAVVFPVAQSGISLERLLVSALIFAALCFSNCALISVWEEAVDRAHGQTSLALQLGASHAFTHVFPWGITLACVAIAWMHAGPVRTVAVCGLASGILLGVLDLAQPRIGPRKARALADVALMTPALVLAFEAGWF